MTRQAISENTTQTVTTRNGLLRGMSVVQYVVIGLVRIRRALRQNRALLRRSLTASLVVGTVLVMINQGPALLNGDLQHALSWRIPMNYLVPFLVATWGALANRRR